MLFRKQKMHINKKWLRVNALCVALTLFLPHLIWAFEPSVYLSPRTVLVNNQPFEIPVHAGRVFDSFQGAGNGPVIIHIQDLHCNFEVQSYIAKIIDALAGSRGITLVTIEGASLPVNVRKLSSFPDEQVKKDVGIALMREGKISGAEFYAATGQHAIQLVGIENPEHYRTGRSLVNTLLNSENQGYIDDVREDLDELKTTLYSPALLDFDAAKKHFRNGEISLLKYSRFLTAQAAGRNIPLTAYPQVQIYLAEAADVRSAINTDQLYSELDRLDAVLRQGLYNRPEQIQLDGLIHRLDIIERLLNISATPEEVDVFRKTAEDFKISNFETFINHYAKTGNNFQSEIYDLDHVLELSGKFYANADERSRDFIANLTSRLRETRTAVAVLITGGYHTEQILAQLKSRNISYLAVKPNLTQQDLVNPYFALLRNRRTPLERLLSQDQKAIALAPFFLEWPDANADVADTLLPETAIRNYRVVEAKVEVDFIRRLIRSGITNLKQLKERFERRLVNYSHTLKPDLQHIVIEGHDILIPFINRFLAWVSPRDPNEFSVSHPLQTDVLGQDAVAYYETSRLQEVAHHVRESARLNYSEVFASVRAWCITNIVNRYYGLGRGFNPSAAGAIGKIKIESIRWQEASAIVVVRKLDQNGKATGPVSELKIQVRPFNQVENATWTKTLAEWENIYRFKSDWHGNDREILGDIIQHAQDLSHPVAANTNGQGAQGLHVISGIEVLRGPPVEVLAGLGLPGAVFLKSELLQADFSAAVLHEVGESLNNPEVDHTFLRGVGERARKEKTELTPEDIGFVGRILGPEAQEHLTQTIKQLKRFFDPVWESVRSEALWISGSSNTFSGLPKHLLEQNNLEEALSGILSVDLANSLISPETLKTAILEALAVPEVRASIRRDLVAIKDRDAAVHTLAEPFFHFKGFHALEAYRVAHWLLAQGRRHDALTLQSQISKVYGVDIHPAAKIGSGVVLDHATGVVIGETAEVGDDVTILHGVTLGGTGKQSGDRHPKVGKDVFIGAGAQLFGNIRIGEGSKIAGNSTVLNDVPAYATVAGSPARVVRRGVAPTSSIAAIREWFRGVVVVLRRYSNVHRGQGQNSQVSTELFEKAREIVLEYLRLDNHEYTLVFANPLRVEQLQGVLSADSYKTVSSQEFGLALGINAVAVKTAEYKKLAPIQPGGGTVQLVSEGFVIWAEGPDVQEGGTPNISGIIAFAKAIRVAEAAGIEALKGEEPARSVEEIFADNLNDADGRPLTGEALSAALIPQWLGAQENVPTTQGDQHYVQFDNGASTPTFQPVWDAVARTVRQPQAVLEQVIARVKTIAADFFHAPLERYEHIFAANTTEAINLAAQNIARIAKTAKEQENIETVVVNTLIEHNSNELPWRHLPNVSLERLYTDADGFINLWELEKLLQAYNVEKRHGNQRIKLVTISGASNVLGSMNDIGAVSVLAHKYGAQILVDGAQLTAHREVNLERDQIDYYAYSGHKTYASASASGGLIVKKDVLNLEQKQIEKYKASGESNAAGIAGLGKILELLQRIGMKRVEEHERELTRYAQEKISKISGVTIYGAQVGTEHFENKGSVLAFSVASVPHNRVAQLLAEDWGIGVRNGCFCAHILLKYLLGFGDLTKLAMNLSVKWFPNQSRRFLPGLVRASFGLENTKEEIDRFVEALTAIAKAGAQEPLRNRILARFNLAAPSLPKTVIGKTIEHFTKAAVDEVYAWKNQNVQTEESTPQGKQGLSTVAETPEKLQTTQASAPGKIVSESSRANAPPAFREWLRGVVAALKRYSNVHRGKGQNSQISTELFEKARGIVLEYLKLDPNEYTVLFANPLRVQQLASQLPAGSYRTLSSQDLGLALGINTIAIKTTDYKKLAPIQPGGGTVQLVSEDFVIWAEGPDTQEGGTPDIAGIIAFAKAVRIAQTAGIEVLQEKDAALPVEAIFADSLQDEAGKPLVGEALEKALIPQWVGAHEKVSTAQGDQDYIQFDNGASTPAFGPIWDVVTRVVRQPQAVLEQVVERVKKIAADFFHAPQDKFEHIFAANTTEAINIASWNIARRAQDAKEKEGIETVVVNTLIEHNSNELPWRHLPNVSLERLYTDEAGFIDLGALETLLQAYNEGKLHGNKRIRLVTLSGASNVLGSMNDIGAVSALAHKYGTQILVDGAQLTAHREVNLERDGIDYYAYSGHKMYAPFGSGGLIVNKKILKLDHEQVEKYKASGESNAAGIAAVGKGLELLQRIGMQRVEEHERELTRYALEKLNRIPGITVYGAKLGTEQFGNKGSVLAFSVAGVPHNRAAQLLAEHWGIGVRNGCFCAHILLKYLLGIKGVSKLAMNLSVKWFPSQARKFLPGLVRASFGLENTKEEIDRFALALEAIAKAKTQEPWRNRILAGLNLSAPSLPQTEIGKTIEHFTEAVVKEVYEWPEGSNPSDRGPHSGPEGQTRVEKQLPGDETLDSLENRETKPAAFTFGYAVAQPGNVLLQTWRAPRELFITAVYGLFAGLDWLAERLDEKSAPTDSEAGLNYLGRAERRYFPLNSVESQRYRKIVRNGFFREGSLRERVFGRYRAEHFKIELLVDTHLVQAVLAKGARQRTGVADRVVRLRSGVASLLIRQIYYYRSSEYYGLSLTARLRSRMGTEEYNGRRNQFGEGITTLISDENDPEQIGLLAGYLLQRSPQSKAYFIRGKLWKFKEDLLKELIRNGFQFAPHVDLDRLPEKIWEAIKAKPETLKTNIDRALSLQAEALKRTKPDATFAKLLPGTLSFKEFEKIRREMPAVDEARRIIRMPFLDKQQLLDAALVQQTVELPARRLVEKIRALGLEPGSSNAYGPDLKGVIWFPPSTDFETTAYFTPLTAEDYNVEALAQEPLGTISRGSGGKTLEKNSWREANKMTEREFESLRREKLATLLLQAWLRTAPFDSEKISFELAQYSRLVKSLGLATETITVTCPVVNGKTAKSTSVAIPVKLSFWTKYHLALTLARRHWGLDENGKKWLQYRWFRKSVGNSA
jgi:serine O-acetyltransferase